MHEGASRQKGGRGGVRLREKQTARGVTRTNYYIWIYEPTYMLPYMRQIMCTIYSIAVHYGTYAYVLRTYSTLSFLILDSCTFDTYHACLLYIWANKIVSYTVLR